MEKDDMAEELRLLEHYAKRLGLDPQRVAETGNDTRDTTSARAEFARVHEGLEFEFPPELVDVTSRPVLDFDGFLGELDLPLRQNALGWAMQLQSDGNLVATRQWRRARIERDGLLNWAPAVTQHVASLSKMITATALMKLIGEHGVSIEDRLANFLPDYWDQGPYVFQMTVRQLLRHRAGLGWANLDTGGVKISDARELIAKGANRPIPVGQNEWGSNPDYDNGNYTVARVIMAVIAGAVDKGLSMPILGNDLIWNALTTKFYVDYVRENIFQPAGIPEVSLSKRPNNSLAYSLQDLGGAGWNSGDFDSRPGPIGWHFTVEELLKFAIALRTHGTILRQDQYREMRAHNLGFEIHRANDVGIYFHGGSWTKNSTSQNERAMLFLIPEKIELAILLNSPKAAAESDIQDLVMDAYRNNVTVVKELP